jgi:hypothetical protein
MLSVKPEPHGCKKKAAEIIKKNHSSDVVCLWVFVFNMSPKQKLLYN